MYSSLRAAFSPSLCIGRIDKVPRDSEARYNSERSEEVVLVMVGVAKGFLRRWDSKKSFIVAIAFQSVGEAKSSRWDIVSHTG